MERKSCGSLTPSTLRKEHADDRDRQDETLHGKYTAGKVSIIIPAYNAARYLPQAIESALNQTYPLVEVIVVDDGSTDDTASLLARYADRITTIQKSNGGWASARNAGIKAMTGEWYKGLDADDVLYPEAVESFVRAAKQLGDRGKNNIFYSAYDLIDEKGQKIGTFTEIDMNDADQFELCTYLLHSCTVNVTASLWHRSIFDRFALYDEKLRYAIDHELYLRLCLLHGCRLWTVPGILGAYRMHGQSISSNNAADISLSADALRRSILEKIDDKNLRESYVECLAHIRRGTFRNRIRMAVEQAGKRAIRYVPAPLAERVLYWYACRRFGHEYAEKCVRLSRAGRL